MPERANWTRVGVGSGRVAGGADRVLDPRLLGGLDQQLEDLGREGCAAVDHRARPERVGAQLLLVDPRGVGGMGDVDDDGEVGLDREGRGAGAEEADLLLHGGDRGKAGVRADPRSWQRRSASSAT